MRFIFREFPLDELAVAASMLARCAGGEKAMAMIDVLFASQDKWAVRQPVPVLLQIAKQAGFTEKSFDKCLKDQKLYNNIMAMRERGTKEYKVESTPTLFVNGKIAEGRRHDRGAREGDRAAAQELTIFVAIPSYSARDNRRRSGNPCCGAAFIDSFSAAIRHAA